MDAIAFGLIGALVVACVALAALSIGIPVMWRDYSRRSDREVDARVAKGQLDVRVTQLTAERDGLKKAVEERDATIARLEADLREERRHGLQGLDDADLLRRGNGGGVPPDGRGGEAGGGPRPGSTAGPSPVRP